MLWPGGNPDAIRLRLNQTVAEIRRALKPIGDPLISDRFSLGLNPSVTTDVQRFFEGIDNAMRESDPALRAVQLKDASNLVHELLPGVFADWSTLAGDEIQSRLREALEERRAIAIAAANWKEAFSCAWWLCRIDPYSEAAHQILLECSLESDQRSKALFLHEHFEKRLRSEFASLPSASTQKLVERIRGDTKAPLTPQRRSGSALTDTGKPAMSGTGGFIEDVLDLYILANDAERAMRLAGSLLQYWNLKGELSTAWKVLKRILRMPSAQLAPPDARCSALITFGIAATSLHDIRSAGAALPRALDIANGIAQAKLRADALRALGQFELRQVHFDLARIRFEESLKPSEEAEDTGGQADSWTGLGEAFRFACRYVEAEKAHARAMVLRKRMGREDRAAHSVLNLGIISSRTDRLDLALSQIQSALKVLRSAGSRVVVADCLMEIGGVCAYKGQAGKAARLLAAVSHLREEISAPLPLADRPDYVRFLSKCRESLGKDAFRQEWDRGRLESLEAIIDYALLIDLL